MKKTTLAELIIKKFGEKSYIKAINYPNNKINIIFLREDPIKIRSIILENEREFHLIIDENKSEIYHDCPNFLIYSEREKKICIHFLKLLLSVKENIAFSILEKFNNYYLTSEDFGSKKKSKNYQILANSCFEINNYIEGLSYLNKAIINQFECEEIVERFLLTSIKNNLFIELFEFLKSGYENDLGDYFSKYKKYIEKGFKKFLSCISDYSFFDLLRIINFVDAIFQFKEISFVSLYINKFRDLINSQNLNEKYFSFYFIKKNIKQFEHALPDFYESYCCNNLDILKQELIDYFFTEIDNFCIIDKLKLMKKQFEIIGIEKKDYYEKYKNYKDEIRELEKKVYLKKFSFLKLLIEKYNVKISKVEFRKKRNTYIVNHDQENLKNPVYKYIISHIGFYGSDFNIIKSTDIGLNYFLIKELFLDDLNAFPDIFYYKKQFWGDNDDGIIKSIDGFSLFRKPIRYYYDIDQKYSNINDILIIEWDLVNKPRQGTIVNAYGSQIIIPDYNNPLFHDLKPFDLCYCKKNPVKIEGNIIKTINVITKCSFKDAIKSISKGVTFIEGYYPLSLVKLVLDKEISPFKAYEIVLNNPNRIFVPDFSQFIKVFREFLFNYVNQEKEYIFEELKNNPERKFNQFLIVLNLINELSGLDLPYSRLIQKLLDQKIELFEFKKKLLDEVDKFIKAILEKRDIGSTIIFNLKKMRNTPFSKYSNKIIKIRKEEAERAKIFKDYGTYNLSYFNQTYYGQKISEILKFSPEQLVKPDLFHQIKEFALKLNLKLNILEEETNIT